MEKLFHNMHSLIFVLCLCAAVTCWAAELQGRVVGIVDGDTLDLLTPDHQQVRIRLVGIDAPERRQPYGDAAKRKLSDLVFGHDVKVEWRKMDRYGRYVGRVIESGRDIDLAMIEAGYAWHYRKYANEQMVDDRLRYLIAESEARKSRLGLWQDSSPVPPWEFRSSRVR